VKIHPVVLGFDDAAFNINQDSTVQVFAIVMRGKMYTDAIFQTKILIDDPDPNSKIIDMIKNSGHLQNLQYILHQGVTIGGFGILDCTRFYEELKIPTIFFSKKEPDMTAIKSAIGNLSDYNLRSSQLKKLPPLVHLDGYWIQSKGFNIEEFHSLITKTVATGTIPEVLRLSHLIGSSFR
jgi:uncharacterized protein